MYNTNSKEDETMTGKGMFDLGEILNRVQSELEHAGIAVDLASGLDLSSDGTDDPHVKVVCVAPGLKESADELGKSPRDQVVMVRIDNETSKDLDGWIETGAVKSRSAAAALFMKEGLSVRADELAKLKGAIDEVEEARSRLRERADEIFGGKS